MRRCYARSWKLASGLRTRILRLLRITPVGLDAVTLGELFAKGRNRRDVSGEAIEELGFALDLWNGASPAIGLAAFAGSFSASPGILNSFVLDLPPPEAEALGLYAVNVAEPIFEAVVSAWEPDWATWTSPRLSTAQGAAAGEPLVGWMTYLATPVAAALPGITTWSLQGGTALRIGQDVSRVGQAEVLDVRARLAKAGALRANSATPMYGRSPSGTS